MDTVEIMVSSLVKVTTNVSFLINVRLTRTVSHLRSEGQSHRWSSLTSDILT